MKAALAQSSVEEIIGVCRSGKIKDNMHDLVETAGYKDRVKWMKGDISTLITRSGSATDSKAEVEEWEGMVDESTGVISCVGMFALSNDTMRQMNGDANKALVETVKRAGAEHMVFISAYEVEDKLPFPLILAISKESAWLREQSRRNLAARARSCSRVWSMGRE